MKMFWKKSKVKIGFKSWIFVIFMNFTASLPVLWRKTCNFFEKSDFVNNFFVKISKYMYFLEKKSKVKIGGFKSCIFVFLWILKLIYWYFEEKIVIFWKKWLYKLKFCQNEQAHIFFGKKSKVKIVVLNHEYFSFKVNLQVLWRKTFEKKWLCKQIFCQYMYFLEKNQTVKNWF